MANTILVPYTGAAPGADTNTYTLLDTQTKLGEQSVSAYDMARYVAAFKNSHAGTLKIYASNDGTVPSHQIFERLFSPSITQQTNNVDVPILMHSDLLVQWVNGGTAQSPWYCAQAMVTGDATSAGTGYDDNLNLVAGSMVHPITTSGSAIQIGPNGQLLAAIQWAATGAPVGVLSLEYTRGGTTWYTVPGASTEFTQPAGVAGSIVCSWRELQIFDRVRITYTSTSAGAANTSLAIQAFTR